MPEGGDLVGPPLPSLGPALCCSQPVRVPSGVGARGRKGAAAGQGRPLQERTDIKAENATDGDTQ